MSFINVHSVVFKDTVCLQDSVDAVFQRIQHSVSQAKSYLSDGSTSHACDELECVRQTVSSARADVHHRCAKVRKTVTGAKVFHNS